MTDPDTIRERQRISQEDVAARPYRVPVATTWYAEDVAFLLARLRTLEDALRWYDDHKTRDGSYDGELFGDLRALAAAEPGDET